jgi:hypothetical protein
VILVPGPLGPIPVPNPTKPFSLAATAKTIAAIKLTAASELATVIASTVKGFDQGGFTGPGIGAPDSSGDRIAGVVHANEYVIPKFIAQDPVYADTIGYLEARRQEGFGNGYAEGGPVAPDQPAAPANTELTLALQMLVTKLNEPIEATALIGDDEIARHDARKKLLNDTRENAKIS